MWTGRWSGYADGRMGKLALGVVSFGFVFTRGFTACELSLLGASGVLFGAFALTCLFGFVTDLFWFGFG